MTLPRQKQIYGTSKALLASVVLFSAWAASACSRSQALTDGTGAASASAATPTAPPIEGRCINTTKEAPYESIYFYPSHNEMFFSLKKNAERVPIVSASQSGNRVTFSYRWSEGDAAPKLENATVTLVGDLWAFDFESLKDCSCRPTPGDAFYKPLPEVSEAKGRWSTRGKKDRFTWQLLPNKQQLVWSLNGQDSVLYYRVLDVGDAGVRLATIKKPPNNMDDEGWPMSNVNVVGEHLIVSIDDLTLTLEHQPDPAAATSVAPAAPAPVPPGVVVGNAPLPAGPSVPAGASDEDKKHKRQQCVQRCIAGCHDDSGCERTCVASKC